MVPRCFQWNDLACAVLCQQFMCVNSTVQTSLRRFEPNVQMIWGQVIVFTALGAFAACLLDYFKLALERSFIRAAGVWIGVFVGVLVIYWFRSGRHGGQTLAVDEKGIAIETKDRRVLLPWNELAEITLTGDSVLKFYNGNSREALRLDNLGFTPEQWKEIKELFQSRGYQFKLGYSAL